MTIDTQRLRVMAMAATTGEWLVERYGTGMHEIYINISESEAETVIGIPPDGSSVPLICSADAEYIAAANPATMLALLDEIDRLRAIKAAAMNLAKVKGRHNSEIAMNQLLEALK